MLDLSVIIPVLNAGDALAKTIAPLRGKVHNIVVSDGGSSDEAVARAEEQGAMIVTGPPGRGGQLRRGAAASRSAWLLFLHADTVLDGDWAQHVTQAMENGFAAAYFQFALDDDAPVARRWERRVAWRARTFGLPYGDQGLLISRRLYDQLGGYRDIPLMEDVDFVRRIGRARLIGLKSRAVTSAAKFQRDGYTWRSAKNLVCLGLFLAGVSPAAIKRIYG